MKTLLLTWLIVLGGHGLLQAQAGALVLSKKGKDKEKTVQKGEVIKIYTYDDIKLKGELDIVGDSALVIAGDTVLLSGIEKIRTKSLASKITGGFLTALGAIGIFAGTAIVVQAVAEGGLAYMIGIIFGVPVIATGTLVATSGVIVILVGKKHRQPKWDFSIKTL